MPITPSAKRAERRRLGRTERNLSRWRQLDQAIKLARRRPSDESRRSAQAIIDKAKKWRIISSARASRLVSRLYRSSQKP